LSFFLSFLVSLTSARIPDSIGQHVYKGRFKIKGPTCLIMYHTMNGYADVAVELLTFLNSML
jgi:hypothetical protein